MSSPAHQATRSTEYRKLATSQQLFGLFRKRFTEEVFVGKNDLLVVRTQSNNERHFRFSLENIAGFTVEETQSLVWEGLALFILFVSLGLLGAAVILYNEAYGIAPIYLVFLPALIALGGLLYHLAKGPTCRVFLYTGVSAVQLHALSRRRQAAKFIEQLRQLVPDGTMAGPQPPPLQPEVG